jgi:hypothetical protein
MAKPFAIGRYSQKERRKRKDEVQILFYSVFCILADFVRWACPCRRTTGLFYLKLTSHR